MPKDCFASLAMTAEDVPIYAYSKTGASIIREGLP